MLFYCLATWVWKVRSIDDIRGQLVTSPHQWSVPKYTWSNRTKIKHWQTFSCTFYIITFNFILIRREKRGIDSGTNFFFIFSMYLLTKGTPISRWNFVSIWSYFLHIIKSLAKDFSRSHPAPGSLAALFIIQPISTR